MTGYYTVGLIVIAVCCFATLAIWFVNRKQVKDMDAFEFCKEFGRMCKAYCEPPNNCDGCPMNEWNTSPGMECIDMYGLTDSQIRERINIVEKWSKEHPKKTMMQDFFEKHPNALKQEDETPRACPWILGYVKEIGCSSDMNCTDCWNRPLEE